MPENISKDNIPEDKTTVTRKRLIFRSWHRGTKEIDHLLGGFADAHLKEFDLAQLEIYDRFLNNSDPDIYNWITGAEPVPPAEDNAVVQLLLRFYKA